jgi:hypothetical protein
MDKITKKKQKMVIIAKKKNVFQLYTNIFRPGIRTITIFRMAINRVSVSNSVYSFTGIIPDLM